jgi:hypothetical protein
MAAIINAVSGGAGGIIVAGDTTGQLQLQTGGTTAMTVNANQQALFVNNISAPNTFGFKNRIINGAMLIDQWHGGGSYTPTGTSYPWPYAIDRWCTVQSQASKYTIQQFQPGTSGYITPPQGFSNYLGITSTSAYSIGSTDTFELLQRIEGFNLSDLNLGTANARAVTLSFWVYSSLTGTFGGTWDSSADDYCYVYSYTINSANTWQYVTVNLPGPTSGTWGSGNALGGNLTICYGAGSSNLVTPGQWYTSFKPGPTGQVNVLGTNGAKFLITGIQLEVGTQATPFDMRDYGNELRMCERYYTTLPSTNASSSSGSGRVLGTCNGSAIAIAGNMFFPVSMRVAPTITIFGSGSTTGSFNFYSAGSGGQTAYTGSASSSTIANSSSMGFGVNLAVSTLPATYTGWSDMGWTSPGHSYTINAEL